MKNLFFAIAVLSFVAYARTANAQPETETVNAKETISPAIRFHRFGPEDGLSSLLLSAVERDSKGFLWIATFGGLYRYDGYRFRHFKHDPTDENSLSGDRLRSLKIDRYDRIWVGTESNGVSMYDPAEHKFYRFGNDPLDAESYFAGQTLLIRELSDGSMAFMVFGDGMARITPDLETIEHYRADPSRATAISGNHCLAADIDPKGDLWTACFGGTVQKFLLAEGEFETPAAFTNLGASVPTARVSVLSFLRDGTLLMGTDGVGVMSLPGGAEKPIHIDPVTHSPALTADFITKIEEDEKGDVWIGYRDAGIDVVDREFSHVRHLAHAPSNPTSLSSNNTFGISQDEEGLVWVPTYGAGLNVTSLRTGGMEIYEGTPDAPGPFASNANIRLLAELDDGRLVVSSRDNQPALFRLENQTFVMDEELDLEPRDDRPFWIVSAVQDQTGTLWLPTVGRGLYKYDLNSRTAEFFAGTEDWNIVAAFEGSDGNLWVSEFSRGIFLIDIETGAMKPITDQIPDAASAGVGLVHGMMESSDKSVWLSSRSGVYRYSPTQKVLSRISSVNTETGVDRLLNSHAMTQDSKGRVWVAGGQIAYTLEPFASMPQFIFPFEQTVFQSESATSVTEDSLGRLWFSVQSGLLGFDPATGSTMLVEEGAGAPTNVPEGGAVRLSNGAIMISSVRRLTSVVPSLFDQSNHVKAPEVTRLVVGGDEMNGVFAHPENAVAGDGDEAQVIVSPEAQDFTVEYASLTPIAAQSYRYAHRLVGFNREWIETDATRRSATYTNLAPGTYRLLMRAFDSNGRTSLKPSELIIRVLPAYYQTLWFRALVAAATLMLLYAAYQARIAVMKANQAKLERQVKDRTAKIETQRSELADRNVKIERTMTELKETQGMLIQSEKLAALGGVVAGVAHEVNTPIGLVVSGASQIEDEVSKIQAKVEANKITKTDLQQFLKISADLGHLTLKNAQKAAELIKSFKRISADQTSQQIAEIDLMEYLRDTVTSMKPVLVETGHRVVVNGPDELIMKSNPGTLSQVVTNLITNALEHAYPDGKQGTITISAEREADKVLLSVGDDGRGIPEADREHVFEPFFTTTRGNGNTGLGLHIVHNMIVGGLEGSIELGEAADKGALFKIRIPDLKTSA